ncbi:MAG: hypothetical protein JJ916_12190 [Phycisphaerales bacterium]|nr:hypothetical protein [Phycisphaerales bacterium]
MQLFMFFFDDNGTPKPLNTGDAENSKPIKSIQTRRCPRPPYHKNAPEGTSEVAAAMIMPHAANQRNEVFQAILNAGEDGLTADEGQRITGVKSQSYTARRYELAKMGLVRDSGARRLTESGRPASVWVAVTKRGDSADA